MSKPIKITEELISSALKEFGEKLRSWKMMDGEIKYSKSFVWDEEDKAHIVFHPDAFAKMTMLVQSFDSEVAWHGTAHRDEEDETTFYIDDILVYPQLVTGATVNTDQEKYQEWLYSHEDEVFNNIRMQGHSHVNFGTTPSGVDLTHQEKILDQLDDDMFYIFMIWNRKFERTIKIYDLKNNTLYENKDIAIRVGDRGLTLDEFVKDAKTKVVSKSTATVYTASSAKPVSYSAAAPAVTTTPVKTAPAATPTKEKEKEKPKEKEKTSYGKFSAYDDDDYGYGGYAYGYGKYYRY